MFCPACKCEYIPGVRECADCGVPLVDELDSAAANPRSQDDVLATVWAGNDAGECNAIKMALEAAGIPFTDKASSMNFIFPSMGNKYEVWVPSLQREKAQEVLTDLDARIDPTELTDEEIASLALPISEDDGESGRESVPDDLPEDWDKDAEGKEVWSGAQEDFADMLRACLRENGIPSRKSEDANVWRITVPEADESLAREIVRQVVDASPPQ